MLMDLTIYFGVESIQILNKMSEYAKISGDDEYCYSS